jgi:hypothetical protein
MKIKICKSTNQHQQQVDSMIFLNGKKTKIQIMTQMLLVASTISIFRIRITTQIKIIIMALIPISILLPHSLKKMLLIFLNLSLKISNNHPFKIKILLINLVSILLLQHQHLPLLLHLWAIY